MQTKITLESIDKKIDAKIDMLDRKVEVYRKATIDRFDSIDGKLKEIDGRFDTVDKRFDAMDRRFDSLEENMNEKFSELAHFLKNATITVRENPFPGFIDLG